MTERSFVAFLHVSGERQIEAASFRCERYLVSLYERVSQRRQSCSPRSFAAPLNDITDMLIGLLWHQRRITNAHARIFYRRSVSTPALLSSRSCEKFAHAAKLCGKDINRFGRPYFELFEVSTFDRGKFSAKFISSKVIFFVIWQIMDLN